MPKAGQVVDMTQAHTNTHIQLHRAQHRVEVVVVVDKEIHLKIVVKNSLTIVTACCCLRLLRGDGEKWKDISAVTVAAAVYMYLY